MDAWRFWRRGLFAATADVAEGSGPADAPAQRGPAPRKGLERIVLGTKGGPQGRPRALQPARPDEA